MRIGKYLLGLSLPVFFVVLLVAHESASLADPPHSSAVVLDDGQVMTIIEGSPDESQAGENESTMDGDDAYPEGCRVVLEYCRDPDTGEPWCSYWDCTPEHAADVCQRLYDETC